MTTFQVGDVVPVKGISQKGKARVKAIGDRWTILRVAISVPCLEFRQGLLLECDGYSRWMAINNDRDFEMTGVPTSP